ncbi:MAG: rhomboid family intramembrane serine protease [Bacteroidota bacterium]
MIPLRGSIRSQTFPIFNISLIVVNVLIFVLVLLLGEDRGTFFNTFGVVPANLTSALRGEGAASLSIVPLFTSMFLHAGPIHLLGNMLFLWVFGDNVEDSMGHFRYLVFYVLCGVGATGVHIVFAPFSEVPVVGASGAIAGVLGAYILLFPHSRVLTLIPIVFFFHLVKIPAWVFLGIWFVMQFFSGLFSIAGPSAGGVAWWAHVGGFASGAILLYPFRRRRRDRQYL